MAKGNALRHTGKAATSSHQPIASVVLHRLAHGLFGRHPVSSRTRCWRIRTGRVRQCRSRWSTSYRFLHVGSPAPISFQSAHDMRFLDANKLGIWPAASSPLSTQITASDQRLIRDDSHDHGSPGREQDMADWYSRCVSENRNGTSRSILDGRHAGSHRLRAGQPPE